MPFAADELCRITARLGPLEEPEPTTTVGPLSPTTTQPQPQPQPAQHDDDTTHCPSPGSNVFPPPGDPANQARNRPTGRAAKGVYRTRTSSVGALGDPGWKRDLPRAPCADSAANGAHLSTDPAGVRHGRSFSSRSPMARQIRPGHDLTDVQTPPAATVAKVVQETRARPACSMAPASCAISASVPDRGASTEVLQPRRGHSKAT